MTRSSMQANRIRATACPTYSYARPSKFRHYSSHPALSNSGREIYKQVIEHYSSLILMFFTLKLITLAQILFIEL